MCYEEYKEMIFNYICTTLQENKNRQTIDFQNIYKKNPKQSIECVYNTDQIIMVLKYCRDLCADLD